ncbi:DUF7344 domain-containing protein [Halogeometricum limi]|uniref:DUF7344 domain-containing protein n=1 Tax=Halogeometricum limi TaxID=555875 RepID=A0A1I6HU29_9EURY|nr:hypothetical protein [Halogeometricum limi]SFR57907.1 hypothetical protein SAMN04488124_2452 [Halogeometricum limi]
MDAAQRVPERSPVYHTDNPRRRDILAVLSREEPPLPLDELTEEVADLSQVGRRANYSVEDRRALEIAFHHLHLPVLENAGIVEYDPVEKEVVAWPPLEPVWTVSEARPGPDSDPDPDPDELSVVD